MHLPENCTVEYVVVYPTRQVPLPALPLENGEEPVEKKGRSNDTTVVFHVSLTRDDIISGCYLSGMGVPQYESVSIYSEATGTRLASAKRTDIERMVESSYSAEKINAYRKMIGVNTPALNQGFRTMTYHPMIIPYQIMKFEYDGTPSVRIIDQAEELLRRITKEVKRLRFEFEMPFGWSGECKMQVQVIKRYHRIDEAGYPTN